MHIGGPARVRLPANTASPAQARDFADRHLRAWGLSGLLDTCLLLLSELATNAVRHARTSFDVEMYRTPHGVQVTVRDDDPRVMTRPAAAPRAENGRGLILVDALASRWGVDQLAGGKRIWFEVDTGRYDDPSGSAGPRQPAATT